MIAAILGALVAFAHSIAWLVIGGAILQNLLYLIQLVVAQRALAEEPPEPRSAVLWRRSHTVVPPITLMAPAYNEAATVENSVLSLLALDYPRFEVVVINDGSKDETLQVLKDRFDLQPVQRDYERATSHAPIRGIYQSLGRQRRVNRGVVRHRRATRRPARALACSVHATPRSPADPAGHRSMR